MADTMTSNNNKAYKSDKAVQAAYSASKTIREDLKAIKDDSVKLVQDIKDGGADLARDGLQSIKDAGRNELEHLESYLRAKPVRSVAIAFAAGLVLSQVFGARRRHL